jgi:hypothetical protein
VYNCTTATTAACGAEGLAATGLNLVWLLLAAFALLGAGMAVMRLVPKREA